MHTRPVIPVIFILILVFATVCLSSCRRAETRRVLRQMIGSTVVLPEKVTCVQDGEVFPMPEELRSRPKLIVYVDSTECSKCRIDNFIRYSSLFDLSTETGSFEVMMFLSPKRAYYDEVVNHLIQTISPYPVFLDVEKSFRKENAFIPDVLSMQTFFVDASNRILFVGDPIYNNSVMDMFRKYYLFKIKEL